MPSEKKRLSLSSLLMEYPGMVAAAAVLVGTIAVATQIGPSLVSYAINHGLTGPSPRTPPRTTTSASSSLWRCCTW